MYYTMHRTQILLEDGQYERMKTLAEQEGRSLSSLVRDAVTAFLGRRDRPTTRLAEITNLSHGQGLLANSISSTLVIGASLLGSPVSTTHVSTGAIFGIGVWNDRTDWTMVSGIVVAWLGTLPLAAAIAAGVARASMFFN